MSESYPKLLGARWMQILRQSKDGVMWSYRISPPFPSQWFLSRDDKIFYYAFAYGMDLSGGLVDAVRVSAPWARIEKRVADVKSSQVSFLSETIQAIGVQGVRPLQPVELELMQAPIEDWLVASADESRWREQLLKNIREYYQFWHKTNGGIVKEIEKHHAEFFRWVNF